MKLRNVLILAILFCALTAYVVLFERPGKSKQALEPNNVSVLNIRGFDVTGITLECQQSPIVLEKEKGRWFVRMPTPMEADLDTVEALAGELEFLYAVRVIKPEKSQERPDMVQYGLKGSTKRIRVKFAGGEKILVLGKKTPVGNGLYAMVEGQPEIYVLSEGLEKSINKTPEDLRNRVVWGFDLDQIVSLLIKNPAGVFDLSHPGPNGGGWVWKTPVNGKQVNQEILSGILWELRNLKFKSYLGLQEKSANAMAKPLAHIAVLLKGENTPRVLLVGQSLSDGSYCAKLESQPYLFTLEVACVEPMLKDLSKPLETAPIMPASSSAPALKPPLPSSKAA